MGLLHLYNNIWTKLLGFVHYIIYTEFSAVWIPQSTKFIFKVFLLDLKILEPFAHLYRFSQPL